MDQYENNQFPQEQMQPEQAPATVESNIRNDASQPYSGAGVGRKESPFADSPYVMNREPENTYRPAGKEKPVKVKKTRRKGLGRKIVAAVLAVSVLAGGCGITAALVNNRWEAKTTQMEQNFNDQIAELRRQMASQSNVTGSGTVTNLGMSPSQVYARNVPSVVQVTCDVVSQSMFGQSMAGTSVGSGFILTEDGYIVTNYHVIEGASSVTITTYLGDEYKATVVGYESANDVAVLKVEAAGLPAVTIGSSSDLSVGDQVVAIGNALGELTGTMTVGYVSAKDRAVTNDNASINMIQTDAAINSGNSGGPLFNMNGEVVGITTAKYSGESTSGATIEGIGFAIPIDDVLSMVEDLIHLGYVTGAYLGVGVNDVDSAAQYYGIPAGAYVVEVNEGSCAQKAGVQTGDIIIALGEHKVESYSQLKAALRKFKAGETTTIRVYRSGQELELSITLDERPQTEQPAQGTVPQENMPQENMPGSGSFEEWYNYFSPFFGENR